jgi:hypothetical protein
MCAVGSFGLANAAVGASAGAKAIIKASEILIFIKQPFHFLLHK